MRNGSRWAGFMGGLSLLCGACFEGPDWPESVPRGTVITGGGATQIADAGVPDTGFDAGEFDAGDAGLETFACIPQASPNCLYYKNVAPGLATGFQSNCSNLPPTCTLPTVGCCVTSPAGTYTLETCYYAPSTMADVKSACAAGTVVASP